MTPTCSFRVTTTTCQPSQPPASLLLLHCRLQRTAWSSPRTRATTAIPPHLQTWPDRMCVRRYVGGRARAGRPPDSSRTAQGSAFIRKTSIRRVLMSSGTSRVKGSMLVWCSRPTRWNVGDNVSWFDFPEAADATVTSWIAPMKDSDQAELATKFIQDVTGATGRKIFADDGFAEPSKKFETYLTQAPRGRPPA